MVELLINNIYIPVSKPIVTDIEANDIGSATTKSGDISASFTVEATSEVLEAFGNVYNRKIEAKIINNGSVMSSGFVLVSEFTQRRKQITLDYFGEIADIISLLEGKTLKDLDWSDLDHFKTTANIQNSWSATEGYYYPLVDNGGLSNRSVITFNENDFNVGVFLSTTIKKILESVGYTLKGSILNDSFFNKAILLYYPELNENDGIGKTYAQSYISFGSQLVGHFYIAPSLNLNTYKDFDYSPSSLWVAWTARKTDIGGNLDETLPRYNVSRDGIAKVWGYIQVDQFDSDLKIKINGAVVRTVVLVPNAPLNTVSLKSFLFYIKVQEGDYIEAEYQLVGATNSFIYDVRVSISSLDPSGRVEISNYIEEISCSDVLQFATSYYCSVMSVNPISRTVTINKFNDVINNISQATDWTDKIERSKEITRKFNDFNSDYAQRTMFIHAEDDNDLFLEKNKTILEGKLMLDNDVLKSETKFYESPFSMAVYESSGTLQSLRIGRYKIAENTLTANITATTDNLARFAFTASHGLEAGEHFMVQSNSTPIQAYVGTHIIIDVLDSSTVITSTVWTANDTVSVRKYENVNEIKTKLLLNDGLVPVKNRSENAVLLKGVELEFIPLVYSTLDNPSGYEQDGVQKCYATWSTNNITIDGLTVKGRNNGILEEYWNELKRVLENGESVTASIRLDTVDFLTLDFSIPVYIQDFGAYFYINKINDYQYQKGTYKVELIKI